MSKKILILLGFIATYVLGVFSSSVFELLPGSQKQSLQTLNASSSIEEEPAVNDSVVSSASPREESVDHLNAQNYQALKATINKLRDELDKFKQVEARRKQLKKQKKVNYRQRQELMERIYGAEAYRTRYGRERLERAKYEIQSELGLSERESAQLNQLLLEKMSKNALARDSLNNFEVNTKETREAMFAELELARNQHQAEFEEKLRDVLDEETIDKYREFEFEKYQHQVKGIMRNQKDNLYTTIPDISDYQIQQVSNYFDSITVDEELVELGAYGASGQRHYRDYWKLSRSNETLEFLRTILSEQQLEAYTKKYQRKKSQ